MIDLNSSDIGLTKEETEYIRDLAGSIRAYAELTGSDLFIDCFRDSGIGIVAAHGRPAKGSLYQSDITGADVLIENEPMVFYTKETGITMKDARALSQENKVVLQKTMPVYSAGDSGRVIAVMIQERDVSDQAAISRKLDDLEEVSEQISSAELRKQGIVDINDEQDLGNLLLQEAHHRIKNNLQTISSILSLQRRRSRCSETREVLWDDINRINSLAAMYDVMVKSSGKEIDILPVIQRLTGYFRRIYSGEGLDVEIRVKGDHIMLEPSKVQAVILIINELIQNAVKHGFRGREKGRIDIFLADGNMYGMVNVIDDGAGYDESRSGKNSLGLLIVNSLARDKLKGDFEISGGSAGTKTCLRFRR